MLFGCFNLSLQAQITNVDTGETFATFNAAVVAAGTLDGHTLQITTAGSSFTESILGASSEGVQVSKAVIIDGNNANIRNDSGFDRAFELNSDAVAGTWTLKDITLCNFAASNGAAIAGGPNANANYILTNVNVFESGTSNSSVELQASATITNCSIGNGVAGGLRIYPTAGAATVDIINSTFTCNGAEGILLSYTAYQHTINITDCNIGNNGNEGIYSSFGKNTVTTVSNTTFFDNLGGSASATSAFYSVSGSGTVFNHVNNCSFMNEDSRTYSIRSGNSTRNPFRIDGSKFVDCDQIRARSANSFLQNSLLKNTAVHSDTPDLGGNTSTNSGLADVAGGDYNVAGLINDGCSKSCASDGPGLGAVVTIPGGYLNAGETLTSTGTGTYFYRASDGTSGSFTDGVIPASLEGLYVVFWQEVSVGSDPIFAGTVAAVLPVELVRFNGQKQDQTVQLDWLTNSEHNNEGFYIERKNNTNWEEIGYVKGYGNTDSERAYAFTDNDPMEGNNKYRLKQMDFDGHFAYSPIVSIRFSKVINNLNFYPNPAKNTLSFSVESVQAGEGILEIFNFSGKLVSSLNTNLTDGFNQISLDITDWQSGVYFAKLALPNGEQQVGKVIKK